MGILLIVVAAFTPLLTIKHGVGQTISLVFRAFTPTPTPTTTATPTTPPATATPTVASTNTPVPTSTPALLYNCSRDVYNCSSFSTQAAAQRVYDYCVALGFGDIHRLDQDSDGEACESLP